ncbi:MAG: FCD domain-containing protein [Rhizobiales bacterium]|nr:FCD domain-containing protein [Hyphomicrobiales bacterium]
MSGTHTMRHARDAQATGGDGAELPKTLSSHLLERLRWRIITGELEPGRALREQDIEREFGSSRGPVRESLRMLLQNGLVEYQQRRGFRVRTYSVEDVLHLYDLRASLEGLVIASLEGRPLEALIVDLAQSNARMRRHFQAKDIESYFAENQVFHDRIIAYTSNRPITEVMAYVNEISLPVRYRLMRVTLMSRRSLDYHERIVSFLEKGDIAAARRETEEHILVNREAAAALYAR